MSGKFFNLTFEEEQAFVQAENDKWFSEQWSNNFGTTEPSQTPEETIEKKEEIEEEKPNYLIIGLVTIAIAVGAYLIYNNINKAKQ